MAEGDFDLKATLSLNSKNFIDGLKQGKESLGSFSQMIDKVLGPKGKLVLALAAVGAAALKMGQDMNAAMSEIAKGTGATGESLYKLRENVHDALVGGVGRSAQEVGRMVADLNTRFKATGKELVSLTQSFDDFSDVTGVDTKNAINMAADVMAKWNIENEDTNKLLDQLTKASQESGASVESLMNGLKQGQAVFSQFGMSATDTIAYISTLKENGIEVEQALIGMKTALAKFSQEGKDAQTAFAEVSEKIKNASSETEALNISVETFGARNGPEMVKVLRNSSNSVEEFKNKLLEAGGALEATKEASRTSKDAFDDLGGVLKGSFGGIFEGIDTLVKNVIDSLSSVLRKLDPIIRPVVNSIRDIFAFVGEMFFTLVDNVSTFITENSAGFKMIADIAQNTYEVLHTILGNMLEAFKTVFGLISSILQGNWPLAWEYAKQAFMIVIKNILDILSGFINTFSSQINSFTENVINPFIDGINLVAEKLGMPLVEKFEPIGKINLTQLSGLQKKIDETNKKIQEMTGKTTAKITGDLGKVEKTNTDVLTDTTKRTKKETKTELGAWDKLKEGIIKDAEDWSDVVGTAYGTMRDLGTEMFESIGESLVDGGASFEDYAATAVSAIAEVLKSLAAQLTALAVARAANYDYGTAAMAAAGAAAALVAAGVLGAVATKMKSASEETKKASESIDSIGDAAIQARGSIEYFLETLKKIKEGYEDYSVVNYYTTIIAYQNTYNELVDAMNDKFQEVASRQSAITKFLKTNAEYLTVYHSTGWWIFKRSWTTTIRNPELVALEEQLNTSKNELEQLKKIAADAAKEIISTSKNTISSLQQQVELTNQTISGYQLLYTASLQLNEVRKEFNKLSAEEQALDYENYKKALEDGTNNLIDTLTFQLEYFKSINQIALSEQKVALSNMASEVYNSLSSTGAKIGETFVSGMIEGMSKKDFMSSIRDYFREMLLRITIYTDEFQDRLAQIGLNLTQALLTKGDLKSIKKEISDLWDVTKEGAKEVESVIAEVFGEIRDEIEDTTEQIGTNIFDNLISALSEGLSQGEFLENMKKYIRDMLIQTLVYTQSMKSEIEAIGKAISDGLTTGFTDTSLHEIRRDLSYIFNEANKTMVGLDSVLDNVFSGYANGTQNATSGLHLVGEAGPELVRFRGGEQVLNASETRSMLENAGGNTNNFNVTFNNMQDTSAYAMMNQLREYNREMAINGVI